MGTELNLEGMDQLLASLQTLGNKASRVENSALRAGAGVLQKEIEKRAPRSPMSDKQAPDHRHAADHISVSKIKLKGGTRHILVGIEKGDNSEFFYMKFHEFGTSKMPARPFMDPAARESRGAVLEAMGGVVKAGLKL